MRQIPAIRTDLQIIPAQFRGMRVFVVQDSLELVPKNLVLNPELLQLLMLLNQVEDMDTLRSRLVRAQGGVLVSRDEVDRIIQYFDDLFLLDTKKFREARRQLVHEYSQMSIRVPSHSGVSYPDDPGELDRYIRSVVPQNPPDSVPSNVRIKVLIAPHIDPKIGAPLYGLAYSCWPEWNPDRILLMGTGHFLTGGFFSVSDKSIQTPLGLLENDITSSRRLKQVMGGALASDDFAHKMEHSLEFQTIFIQHLLNGRSARIIPVLCGSFIGLLDIIDRPRDHLQLAAFINALREIACDPGTMVVAGVDLSHIGPKFGHKKTALDLEKMVREQDDALLKSLVTGNVESMWQLMQENKDQFNVCGLSTLTVLLEILDGVNGMILDYNMSFEEPTQSAVSYAAGVLWSR